MSVTQNIIYNSLHGKLRAEKNNKSIRDNISLIHNSPGSDVTKIVILFLYLFFLGAAFLNIYIYIYMYMCIYRILLMCVLRTHINFHF